MSIFWALSYTAMDIGVSWADHTRFSQSFSGDFLVAMTGPRQGEPHSSGFSTGWFMSVADAGEHE